MATAKDTTPKDETVVSPEAQAMIAAGATANTVNVDALLAQIQRLQSQMDAINAERGIPSDPVEAALQNLTVHVQARQDSSAELDLVALAKALTAASDAGKGISAKHAADITDLVEEAIESHPHRANDFPYLRTLARDLRKAVSSVGVDA